MILIKIEEYLSLGGLFNPELMEHQKVRDLIIECRDHIKDMKKDFNYAVNSLENANEMFSSEELAEEEELEEMTDFIKESREKYSLQGRVI